jgi:hypothetical protein
MKMMETVKAFRQIKMRLCAMCSKTEASKRLSGASVFRIIGNTEMRHEPFYRKLEHLQNDELLKILFPTENYYSDELEEDEAGETC